MLIAVTSTGKDLDAAVDPRFGPAGFIVIVDADTMVFEVVDNAENAAAFKGAGIQAAVTVSDRGAEALLTGYCGPNAFKTLSAAGVKVASDISGTVRDAVNACREGSLAFDDSANAEAHW